MYTPIRQLMKSAINQVIYYRQRLEAINASLSSRKKKKIPNQVVLVADKIHIRINKISWALLKNGWNVIIVLKDSEYNRSVNLHCSSIFYFENIYHALLISSKFSPVVYHIFSSWNFDLAYFFIKNRPGKIIFDNMDMLTGILKGDLEQQYKNQS